MGNQALSNQKSQETLRRLMLAKAMFLHGLEHSIQLGTLNSMIAVHNLHNAIEMVLQAIIWDADIKIGKQEPRFEDLLDHIDGHEQFKQQGKLVPERKYLRELNKVRNLAQHQAYSPSPESMERWRVVCKIFLEQAYTSYFDVDFEDISLAGLIEEPALQAIMQLSLVRINAGDLKDGLALAKSAFDLATRYLEKLLPQAKPGDDTFNYGFELFHMSPLMKLDHEIERLFKDTYTRLLAKIQEVGSYTILIAGGINLADYRRFQQITPEVSALILNKERVDVRWPNKHPDVGEANWVHQFVTNQIVRWETEGLIGGDFADPERNTDLVDALLNLRFNHW